MATDHEGDNEDARREAALASSRVFQSCFRSSKVTQTQLDKLQELHQKRLALKEKSSVKTNRKGSSSGIAKVCKENFGSQPGQNDLGSPSYEEANLGSKIDKSNISKSVESSSMVETTRSSALRKRKLHWGLDAKERWERKANM